MLELYKNIQHDLKEEHTTTFRKEVSKVMFLTPPESEETIKLKQEIKNDLKSESGKPIAFVQAQRYLPLPKFKEDISTTTQLLE